MKGLLIAIFLGWCGGYRFYKRQIALGIVYLCTFGLFGIGWILDIVSACKEMSAKSKPLELTIEIKGAWAECKKKPKIKREAVINGIAVGADLGVEISYYENAPFYQLTGTDGLDIGAFPSDVSKMILKDYPGAKITAVLLDKNDIQHPHARIRINP